MQNEVENTEYLDRQRRGRLMLLSMLIFFLIPLVAVIAMYKLDWKPKGESIGELVTPARPLTMNNTVITSDGTVAPTNLWKEKWSMVYVAATCEDTCKNKLYTMRQLHVSLYKEIPRMQRVLITTSNQVAELKQRYPEMLILNQPITEITALSNQFNIKNESSINSDRIYLVDPLGHLMMSYMPTTEPARIRKDITRLMKNSWAG
jgi:cytochrome oxidase Cu insertion factor (SCO1/SenC/PrrC family)